MNRQEMKGKWKELKGRVRKRWGKLTDDDLDQIQGDHDRLVGRLQRTYGKARSEVEKEVDEFFDRI